ncbi:hypothetical protein [Halobellus sp. GM3]|uniref:hypothetical protein n=1 Tax=Halobellus sp. GM3 TaxID=3458410 RepID=UPI00403DDBB1
MPERVRLDGAERTDDGTARRAVNALGAASERWDTRLIFLAAAMGYVAVYLATVGDLTVAAAGGRGLTVRTADELSRMFASLGFFRFDAIAIVTVGPVTYLFSPLNALIALLLGVLVGANVALTYLGLVQPKACGLESSTGVLAGVPGLLSGAACCGPTILLVVGIQASATAVTVFRLLIPVAFVLLVGSLLLIGRKVDPTLL